MITFVSSIEMYICEDRGNKVSLCARGILALSSKRVKLKIYINIIMRLIEKLCGQRTDIKVRRIII